MTMRGWTPWLAPEPGPLHQRLVAALRQDLAAGKLSRGTRLPTHRELARALGTSIVTASRAYREAAVQGLVQGTVGRGTYVTAATPQPGPGGRALDGAGWELSVQPVLSARAREVAPDPPGPRLETGGAAAADGERSPAGQDLVDLSANVIAVGAGELAMAAAGGGPETLWAGLRHRYPPGGGQEHRAAVAGWVRRAGWQPAASQVVVTSGAQHAILVALAALARAGDTLFVEALTYPGVKAAARMLGLRLAAVPIDGDGLVPAALADRCRGGRGGLVFCQPSLHNPTSAVMPLARRHALVEVARRLDLTLIEDAAYEFLLPEPLPPLAQLAPERTCHITSGAKALLHGLRAGFLVAPEPLVPRLQAEVAASGLVAAPSLLDLAAGWLRDGRAQRLVEAKRRAVALRQEIARARLTGFDWISHRLSCHLWLTLPPPWQTAALVEWARRRGVAVNAAPAFVADPEQAPPAAVRICLGAAAEPRQLDAALAILASLLSAPPPPEDLVV